MELTWKVGILLRLCHKNFQIPTYIEFLYPDSLSKSHGVTSLEQLSVAEFSGDGE